MCALMAHEGQTGEAFKNKNLRLPGGFHVFPEGGNKPEKSLIGKGKMNEKGTGGQSGSRPSQGHPSDKE